MLQKFIFITLAVIGALIVLIAIYISLSTPGPYTVYNENVQVTTGDSFPTEGTYAVEYDQEVNRGRALYTTAGSPLEQYVSGPGNDLIYVQANYQKTLFVIYSKELEVNFPEDVDSIMVFNNEEIISEFPLPSPIKDVERPGQLFYWFIGDDILLTIYDYHIPKQYIYFLDTETGQFEETMQDSGDYDLLPGGPSGGDEVMVNEMGYIASASCSGGGFDCNLYKFSITDGYRIEKVFRIRQYNNQLRWWWDGADLYVGHFPRDNTATSVGKVFRADASIIL
jgi:hypothetical protein